MSKKQPPNSKSAINFAEDDEFQEFESDDWQAEKVNTAELWEEDWDKDEVSDQFTQQLRAELVKHKQQAGQPEKQQ